MALNVMRAYGVLSILLASSAMPAYAQNVTISNSVNGSPLTVGITGSRFAGAISSLTFRGVEYVNIYDHGRQIQSAIQLDNQGECDNPNEAGSDADGKSLSTSSILKVASAANNVLYTETQAAYWAAPYVGMQRPCNVALPYPQNQNTLPLNTTVLSNYTIERTTSFYGPDIPNLLEVTTSFTVPETRTSSNAEALTGYLPASFNTFLRYDRASRTLTKVVATSQDSAEQHTTSPMILAQANGDNAMGVIQPELLTNPGRGYIAYLMFGGASATAKWSCVFGERNIPAGAKYTYSCPIAVGTVDEVVSALTNYPVSGSTVTSLEPMYRFYRNGRHFLTPSYTEAARDGYVFETTAFHLFPIEAPGLVALYRCNQPILNDHHFISTQADCEGASAEGVYGYAAANPGDGLYPLYRFYKNSAVDHLITINYDEGVDNGYSLDGVLGYVSP